VRFGLLGPLAVWTDHGEPVTVPGRKVRALLADLLVHGGRPVSVDELVEDVWGKAAPADPTAALHVRVSQLRRALESAEPGGRDLVTSQAPGYALRASTDVERFTTLVKQAATSEPHARAVLLAEALDLWRGPALADFADEEFARAAVTRLEEQRLTTVEACAEARLDLGRHRELVAELGEAVTRHPYRERLRAAHLRALHRSGRTGEALDSFQELRRGLADELGLDPGPELTALHQAILTSDSAEDPPAPGPRPIGPATTLPAPVTDLIGRDHAVRRVRELLTTGRLVTITGPGGVGKTSVAVTVARALVDAYPDGVWLIDLTGSGEPAELILSALSIPDTSAGSAGERLATALRERRTLLVLDNCEHVIEPVAELAGALLSAAPGLRVLATSREPLRLRGEARFDLPPLDVPDTDEPARVARSAAVQLFLVRADLGPEDSATVAEVCRRLDGIPLALELAASRVPALGVAELAKRLQVPQDRFRLLGTGPRDAPARQRTLTAVIDWSWRLLTDEERTVLRRLAVHSGGSTLDAAEAVCGGDVLDLLVGLVDRSLVVRDGPRFRLLESVAAYCLDQLRLAGEEPELRRRHAEHYLTVAERAELRGPGQREWLRRLDAEAANLRAAFDTFRREGAAEQALRLAISLVWHRFLRGRLDEARRTLAEALAVPGGDPELRAAARAWHTGLAIRQGQGGAERAAEVLRDYAEPLVEWFLAGAYIDLGDAAAAEKLLAKALAEFRATGDRWGEAATLSTRAMLGHLRDDLPALEHDARRSAELFGELGDEWGVLQATDWLIGWADLTGDQAEGARMARSGLRTAEELGLWTDVAGRLGWLAWLSMQVGDYSRAQEYGAQAKRLAAGQGQRVVEVFTTLGLAFAARRDGKLDPAEAHLRWLVAAAGDGRPPHLSMVVAELGLLAGQRGDREAALAWLGEAFAMYREQESDHGMAWALVGMAAALVPDGRAAELLGAADSARRRGGRPLSSSDRDELNRITTAVRAATPDFATRFTRGGKLTPEQAYLGT
jgi:predicted ATPase/DNA-binding SARP family transcriptional activator